MMLALGSVSAHACPESLKHQPSRYLGNIDLCTAHDRYQKGLAKLATKYPGEARRSGNLLAPRFINLPDWLKKRDRTNQRAWTAYEPAPLTWGQWQASVDVVDARAQIDYANQKISKLDLEWLQTVHGAMMNNLIGSAGKFRSAGEYGMALGRKSALTAAQANGARSINYPGIAFPGRRLVDFKATVCFEDKPAEFRAAYTRERGFRLNDWPVIPNDQFFTDADGKQKQCGYLIYSEPEEVQPQLQAWLNFVNDSTRTWGSEKPETDPIAVAAKAQRWLIAIHPYERGNGRTSRFVMDWLLQSLGLPAPILRDMNDDMYSTEEEWAQEVGLGIRRALLHIETCNLRPNIKGCKILSAASGDKK